VRPARDAVWSGGFGFGVLADGYTAAYVDFDQIGFCLPAPTGDAPT
jgi:hypothetical protein